MDSRMVQVVQSIMCKYRLNLSHTVLQNVLPIVKHDLLGRLMDLKMKWENWNGWQSV